MNDETETRGEKFPGQRTPGGWRPDDYLRRTAREQWRIDDRLGILDWDGTWPETSTGDDRC